MADWVFIAATVDGQMIEELSLARDRKAGFDLRGPANASFSIDGRSGQARQLRALQSDLLVYRNHELIFRGRLGSGNNTIDPDRHTVTFSAVDYRGVLAARIDPSGREYTNLPQADIAWQLVTLGQSGLGGPLGITRGAQRATGVYRTELVEADTPIDTVLDRFQDYDDGFEWWIDPELRFQCATWRGIDKPSFPITAALTVHSIDRSVDTGLYANWVRLRGGRPEGASVDDEAPFADRWAANLAARPEGRISRVETNTDLVTQAQVDAAAAALLADSLAPPAAWTATLTPDRWAGPADAWLGDRIPIVVHDGCLDEQGTARIFQLDLDIDEDGNETVKATLGQAETSQPTPFGVQALSNGNGGRVGPRLDRQTPIVVTRALPDRVERLERRTSTAAGVTQTRIRWGRQANVATNTFTDPIAGALPANSFVTASTVSGNARLTVARPCHLDLVVSADALNAAGASLRMVHGAASQSVTIGSQGGGDYDGAIGWSGAFNTGETIDLLFRAGTAAVWTFRGQITATPTAAPATLGAF